ncbi:uncharacterized protein LOC132757520 isoform X2 [Ruditapes philippinarum]|uniref:uncharacterized protein LOC132757520 isoform X2 n=1 Tax=Ruditapes philippinarum TaxID=129788 RepID=UPI00295B6F16|nr:uncharacterized protein LOC132757520 isoform X2 [Ruditapes philippinarum]
MIAEVIGICHVNNKFVVFKYPGLKSEGQKMDYLYKYMFTAKKQVQVQKTSKGKARSKSHSSSSRLFSFLGDLSTTKKTPKKKTPSEKAKPKKKEGVTGAVQAGPSTSKKKTAYEGSGMGHGGEIMFEAQKQVHLQKTSFNDCFQQQESKEEKLSMSYSSSSEAQKQVHLQKTSFNDCFQQQETKEEELSMSYSSSSQAQKQVHEQKTSFNDCFQQQESKEEELSRSHSSSSEAEKQVQVEKTLFNNCLQQQESKEEEISSHSVDSEFFSFLDDLPTTKKPETPKKKTPDEKAKPKNKEGVTGAKRKALTAGPSTSKKKKAYEGTEMGHGGEIMFELSMMKYLTANKKNGKLLVGIREYYHDDGQLLPSKEGISLTLDQYKRLKGQLASVDKVLKDLS